MLGLKVTGITLVYAEKVKFISFTFPVLHRRTVCLGTGPGSGIQL